VADIGFTAFTGEISRENEKMIWRNMTVEPEVFADILKESYVPGNYCVFPLVKFL